MSSPRTLLSLITLAAVASSTGRLAAQSVDAHIDSLIARTERGDAGARNELGRSARNAVTETGQHRVDAATARATARMALAMAAPHSPPGERPTSREIQWRPAAVRALFAALAADSGDAWSAEQLERLAPYPYTWMNAARELRHLRALDARLPAMPTVLAVARVKMELEVGSADSAGAVLARVPIDALRGALRHHLQAEVDFALGRNALGDEEYYAGARAIADSADLALYAGELTWIATPEDTATWNRPGGTGATREQWLRAFWNRKDLRDGRMPGSRLAEQFRRWRVAIREYRWDPDGASALALASPAEEGEQVDKPAAIDMLQVNQLFPSSTILDDRGRLYLRHGEPERKVNLPGHEAMDFEAWAWATQPKATIVGFTRAGTLRFGMLARNFPKGDEMTLCNLDSRFCVMTANRKRVMTVEYTTMRETAERTEGNPESYYRSADGIIQAYGIPNGGVLVVVAIPIDQFRSRSRQRDSSEVAAAIRVVVGNSAKGEILASLDTVRRWTMPSHSSNDSYFSAAFLLPTPAGSMDVAVVLGDTAHRAGSGTRFPAVPVVAFSGKTLALSDPIIGRAGSGLSWRHNGELVALNPTNAWRRDEPALLTYEVDGQVPGRTYETRYELWKTTGKPKSPSNVITTKGVASAVTETVHRELSLKELDSGAYRLVVRVKDTVTGAESTRERMIPVRR